MPNPPSPEAIEAAEEIQKDIQGRHGFDLSVDDAVLAEMARQHATIIDSALAASDRVLVRRAVVEKVTKVLRDSLTLSATIRDLLDMWGKGVCKKMTDRIPESELAEMERVCEAATKGPYALTYHAQNGHVCTFTPPDEKPYHIRGANPCPASAHYTPEQIEANACFFIESRTALPRTIAALRAAYAREDELMKENKRLKEFEWMYKELCK